MEAEKNNNYPNDGEDRHCEEYVDSDPLRQNTATKEEESDGNRGCGKTCAYVFNNVTVEPTMSLFVLAAILMMLTTQNLGLEKACRVNLNFTKEICDSLRAQTVESQNVYERETQKLIAKFLSYKTYITATVPSILALLVGSWSDKTGHRKIFLIIPIIGQILCGITGMVNYYFFYELRLEHLVFSEAVFEGFTGGWCLAFFTMFAYISAITSEKDRTFRMGMINFALTVGFPVGMGISGILLKKGGYYACYGLSCSINVINLLYNIFKLKDPKRTPEQKQHDRRGFRYFCSTFFDLSNIIDTVRVVFKQGPKNRRLRMCIMMLVVSILFGPMYGEISVLYLSTRYRFNWDEVQFSIFQTYNFITHTFGTIFSLVIFSKYLQWHDSVLGIISTISKFAASFVYCFATTATAFYFAPMVEILNGTSLLAMRSIVSKLVAADELGKVNSIFGLTENLMPLLYVPLYTNVYKATMEALPGAVFLMGAAMILPAIIVFIWLFYEHRKQVRRIKTDEETTKETLYVPN